MRGILLCVGFLMAGLVAAMPGLPWIVEIGDDDEVAAVSSAFPGLRVPLQVESSSPSVVSWEKAPHGKNLWMLTYSVGEVGTQHLYREQRRAVVDVASREVLADLVWKYVPGKGSPSVRQPVWEWKSKELKVRDEAFGRSFRVGIR